MVSLTGQVKKIDCLESNQSPGRFREPRPGRARTWEPRYPYIR